MSEPTALITEPIGLLTILLVIPTLIYHAQDHLFFQRVFKFVPPLVFAYFIPTILTNLSIIPDTAPVYSSIKTVILPASLLLLTLAVDIKAILKLGPKALILFFSTTGAVVIGGPISLLIFQSKLPPDIWKGMSALAGTWIGGGTNMIAIGDAVGCSETMFGMMVIVDVVFASLWMGSMMYLAGKADSIDKKLNTDTSAITELKNKIIVFQQKTTRVTTARDIFTLLSLAFGCTFVSIKIGDFLPELGTIISHGTWKIILVTTFGVGLSFTKLRNLEGAGASKLGTVFLYLLIGVIGASANLKQLVQYPYLMAMGLVWMSFVALVLLIITKLIRAPVFFVAVASQANFGGAASAPLVASAFHPTLATVGVLLGVAGYVLGTYAALICAGLLQYVATL